MIDKVPNRDIILMEGINTKGGKENKGGEKELSWNGADGRMNENGELLVEICEANELVIGGSLLPHKERHKVTWVSPAWRTHNQIDHVMISRRWRSSLHDVRAERGAGYRIKPSPTKITKVVTAKIGKVRNNINEFKQSDGRDPFQLKLSNRFQSLFIEDESQEEVAFSEQTGKERVEEQWGVIENAYQEVSKKCWARKEASKENAGFQKSRTKIENKRAWKRNLMKLGQDNNRKTKVQFTRRHVRK